MKTKTTCETPSVQSSLEITQKIRRDLPILLWDGDCGFCARWIDRLKKITKGQIQYVPYQSLERDNKGRLKEYPQVSAEDCKHAVQLIMPNGFHYQAAEAVFRSLDYAGAQKGWLWLHQQIPGFRFLFEFGYRWIAHHRSWF